MTAINKKKYFKFNTRKTKGQSLIEFCLIFPLFLLFSLGLIQLSLIFLNSFLVKYTSFIVGRVAVAYYYEDEKIDNAKQAERIMKLMLSLVNSKKILSFETGKNILLSFVLDKLEKSECEINRIKINGSEDSFINVKIIYNMPLNVPFVNKIFGLFKKDIRNYILTGINCPVYTIEANTIMRCPINAE